MAYTGVEIYFASTQFTAFPFCQQHANSHGVKGLNKHYHV